MANTYEAIATVEVGSGGAADIEFTSIPGTYTDLLLLCSLRVSRTGNGPESTFAMTFNNSGSNYSDRVLRGNGSTASSASSSSSDIRDMNIPTVEATASTFSNTTIYIPNYASSNGKSVSVDNVAENNATASFQTLVAGLWNDSATITSIKFTEPNGSSNFVEHSTATLYGISNS